MVQAPGKKDSHVGTADGHCRLHFVHGVDLRIGSILTSCPRFQCDAMAPIVTLRCSTSNIVFLWEKFLIRLKGSKDNLYYIHNKTRFDKDSKYKFIEKSTKGRFHLWIRYKRIRKNVIRPQLASSWFYFFLSAPLVHNKRAIRVSSWQKSASFSTQLDKLKVILPKSTLRFSNRFRDVWKSKQHDMFWKIDFIRCFYNRINLRIHVSITNSSFGILEEII